MSDQEKVIITKKHKIASIVSPVIAAVVILIYKSDFLIAATLSYFVGVALIKDLPYGRFKLIASIVLAVSSLAYLPFLIWYIIFIIAILLIPVERWLDGDSPGVAFNTTLLHFWESGLFG